MSIDKIKQFVRDHKKELIATTVVVGGIVMVIFGFKCRTKKHGSTPKRAFRNDIVIPDGFKGWDTSMLWREGKYLNAIIDSIPLNDLGELGKEYIKNGLAQPGDIASIIIGVEYEKK